MVDKWSEEADLQNTTTRKEANVVRHNSLQKQTEILKE